MSAGTVDVLDPTAPAPRTVARARGYDHLKTLVLPHPLETRGVEELRQLANARAEDLLGLLVAATT